MNVPVGNLLQPLADERMLTRESSLLWYQRTHFEWELTANRRGVHQIGPPISWRVTFLPSSPGRRGLKSLTRSLSIPRLVPLKSFSLPRRDFFGVPGARSPVQDPIYILGTRDYQHGQPAKYIHWKASARHNRLQEKVFESTQQEKVLLVRRCGSIRKA